MSTVVAISGSPSANSKTSRVASHVLARLAATGAAVEHIRVRDLPAEALLHADTAEPALARALAAVERADAVVLATPTYKAAYSGLLKAFLDLLPQFALSGKAVLPLATGGTTAHVLALDYALRPVVHSLGARHVVQSYFLLDSQLTLSGDELVVHPDVDRVLTGILDDFRHAYQAPSRPTAIARSA
ncbi:NADPH-dependent FMN reductase [Goodfellowiella coeruleoviolacea]|uniref:FMN reductase n=1 Tax=Goodfellowiella coeruleoviolacea TaxID=334858 RepID=A0AAE3KIB2_9PSEU|nr:NADPH-dependent FMN reductase [Goodfellowiella coeruleoviolacea]MCP2167209.1 FMN reductase [Goodfellowiella coeruleoviolacea]